jgi:hypothetical protein
MQPATGPVTPKAVDRVDELLERAAVMLEQAGTAAGDD